MLKSGRFFFKLGHIWPWLDMTTRFQARFMGIQQLNSNLEDSEINSLWLIFSDSISAIASWKQ